MNTHKHVCVRTYVLVYFSSLIFHLSFITKKKGQHFSFFTLQTAANSNATSPPHSQTPYGQSWRIRRVKKDDRLCRLYSLKGFRRFRCRFLWRLLGVEVRGDNLGCWIWIGWCEWLMASNDGLSLEGRLGERMDPHCTSNNRPPTKSQR